MTGPLDPNDEALAAARQSRTEQVFDLWMTLSRIRRRADLALGIGFCGAVGLGCAYGAIGAALDRDWANMFVLLVVSVFLGWAGRRAWHRFNQE